MSRAAPFLLLSFYACSVTPEDGTEIRAFHYPLDLFVDDQSAYVTASSDTQAENVWRVDLDGGAAEQLDACCTSAVDDEAIYMNHSRIPKDGAAATTLVNNSEWIVAVDDVYAYAMRADDAGVGFSRIPKAGGAEETLIQSSGDGEGIESRVSLSDTHVYWSQTKLEPAPPFTQSTTISRISKDGGAIDVLTTTAASAVLAASANRIYWVEHADLGVASSTIVQFDEATTQVSVATSGDYAFATPAIVIYGEHVYWSDAAAIWRASIGGDSSKIAIHNSGDIVDFAIQRGVLYWVEAADVGSLRATDAR